MEPDLQQSYRVRVQFTTTTSAYNAEVHLVLGGDAGMATNLAIENVKHNHPDAKIQEVNMSIEEVNVHKQ